jgi:monoamine oxidase
LSRAGPAAGVAFARDELRRLLGADAAAKFDGAVATDWGENPAFLGAYAYARPGHADARGALRQPFGPLLFAGEAWCDDGLAGTVGGAFRSGERAAAMALDVIGRGAVAGSQARNGARIDT